jgi:hypothetical protein
MRRHLPPGTKEQLIERIRSLAAPSAEGVSDVSGKGPTGANSAADAADAVSEALQMIAQLPDGDLEQGLKDELKSICSTLGTSMQGLLALYILTGFGDLETFAL